MTTLGEYGLFHCKIYSSDLQGEEILTESFENYYEVMTWVSMMYQEKFVTKPFSVTVVIGRNGVNEGCTPFEYTSKANVGRYVAPTKSFWKVTKTLPVLWLKHDVTFKDLVTMNEGYIRRLSTFTPPVQHVSGEVYARIRMDAQVSD